MARTKQRTRLQDFLVTDGDEIRGEDATAAGDTGGAITVSAGDNTAASGTAAGGTVTINAGSAVGGTSTGDGGDIILNPGTSVGGSAGEVRVNGKLTVTGLIDPTGLVLDEQATVPFSTTAGRGTVWVRSDTPNILVFTDDAGTDHDLTGTGSHETLQESYASGNTIVTDATNGPLDVSGTQAISLDASLASNFTVAGADLTLSTTTSGNVVASAAGDVDVDGTSVTVDATSGISLDGAATSNFTITSGDLTVSNSSTTSTEGITIQNTGTGFVTVQSGDNADATLTNSSGIGTPGNTVVRTANGISVGDVQITGGNNTGPSGAGGEVIITAGAITGGSDLGNVSRVVLLGGEDTGGATGGGNIEIDGGPATAGNSDGGNLNFNAGTSTGGNPGNVNIGTSSAFDVNITATGDATGTATRIWKHAIANLDANGPTAPGGVTNETTYFSVENGTEGNLSINFGTGYTSGTGTNTYQVSVVSCGTADTINAFTNNGAGVNPTATTVGSATFSAGDLILVTGDNVDNRNVGIFEVVSHTGTTLTLAAAPTAGAEFVRQQVATTTGETAPVCLVTLSVQRVNASGQYQVAEAVSNTGSISYVDLGSDVATLENAWSNNTGTATTLNTNFTGRVTDGDTYLIETETGNHALVSATAAAGADVVTVGTNDSANATNVRAGTGGVDVTSGGAVDLSASATSSFTVTGADLALSTATSGELDLTSAGLMDLNAGANLDVDVTGTMDFLSTGAFSVDGTGASNVTVTSGTLTVSSVTTGSVLVDGVDGVEINSTGGALQIGNDADTGAINVGTGAAARSITVGNTTGATAVNVDAGTGAINLNTDTTITGKLTVTGMIDPPGITMSESASNPGAVAAGDGTTWVRNDASQTLMFTDDAGVDFEIGAGGSRRMPEIPLTVANVAKTSAGAIAAGLPNAGAPGTHGQNITSGIQYLEFADSTEDDIGFAWDIVLPSSYSGNGLTVEFWLAGDGSASAAANMTGQFERQETGFSIAASSWATAQSATGDTISGTADVTVKATITFTNSQIDGLLAGEGARFAIMRLQSDTYAGVVRMTKGRIYETP